MPGCSRGSQVWRLVKDCVLSDRGRVVPGCSLGVFPPLEISEGLLCHQIEVGWCQAVHRGYFLVWRLVKDCCVVRLRLDCARLFTGGISSFGN